MVQVFRPSAERERTENPVSPSPRISVSICHGCYVIELVQVCVGADKRKELHERQPADV